MLNRKAHLALGVLIACCGALARAAPPEGEPVEPDAREAVGDEETEVSDDRPDSVTVAVLDFQADETLGKELGAQVGETLTIMMSGEPGFTLVERASIATMLREQELSLSGIVDTREAVRVGHLVGARIIVTGRVFPLGEKLLITAKLIGTETSLVDGVLVNGDLESDLSELILKFAGRAATRLRTRGRRLIATDTPLDPLPALRKALSGHPLPTMAVILPEEQIGPARVAAADPAVETEVKRLLLASGVQLRDVRQNELVDWARRRADGASDPWPRSLIGVDLVLAGEAFSEVTGEMRGLVSSAARAEVNLIRRSDGRIVLADRTTTRAVDLAQNTSGRKALQKAGRVIAIKVLQYLAESVAPDQEPRD